MANIGNYAADAVGRFLRGGIKKIPGATKTLVKSAKELSKTTATRIAQQTSGIGTTTTRLPFGGQLPPGLGPQKGGMFRVAWNRSAVGKYTTSLRAHQAYVAGWEKYTKDAIAAGSQKGVTGISYEGLTIAQTKRLVDAGVYNLSSASWAGDKAILGAAWQGTRSWVTRNSQPVGMGKGLRFVGGGVGRGLRWAGRTTLTDPGAKGRAMRKTLYTGAIIGGGGYGAINTINAMRNQQSNSGLAPSKLAMQSVVSGPGYNSWMKMPGRGMSPNNLNTAGLTLALNSKRHAR